jgi:hypothetical protein
MNHTVAIGNDSYKTKRKKVMRRHSYFIYWIDLIECLLFLCTNKRLHHYIKKEERLCINKYIFLSIINFNKTVITMSTKVVLSLHTLPVELVYYILDNLDQFTLLFSICDVCARLNTIIRTYHRYQVNIIFITEILI